MSEPHAVNHHHHHHLPWSEKKKLDIIETYNTICQHPCPRHVRARAITVRAYRCIPSNLWQNLEEKSKKTHKWLSLDNRLPFLEPNSKQTIKAYWPWSSAHLNFIKSNQIIESGQTRKKVKGKEGNATTRLLPHECLCVGNVCNAGRTAMYTNYEIYFFPWCVRSLGRRNNKQLMTLFL